jgi:arsenate reductase
MTTPKVLFLCTGNSCRSQMAEGLLRNWAGDLLEVTSAGTNPAGLNPLAVRAMAEIGIAISSQKSKHIDSLAEEEFTHVITVCDSAREACPTFPATTQTLHWSFRDPADAQGTDEERMKVFTRVRNEIDEKIGEFVRSQTLKLPS